MQVFQDIVRDLTDSDANSDIPHVYNHFSKCLQYNILDGKKNRGLSVVLAYKMLEKPENLTAENIRLANVLGWCVEMVSLEKLNLLKKKLSFLFKKLPN